MEEEYIDSKSIPDSNTNPDNITDKINEDELKEKMLRDFEYSNVSNFDESKIKYQLRSVFTYPSTLGKPGECYCVRFEYLDGLLAAGYSNGYVVIFDVKEQSFNRYFRNSEYAVTSLRWKPHTDYKAKGILLVGTADGKLTHWHVDSGKVLHLIENNENPVMCLDYNEEGNQFVVSGNDKKVKLYDDNIKSFICDFKSNDFSHPGHTNRIFSVCFHKTKFNLLASGGWDSTVQFYDVRGKEVINSLYGHHINGDSLDFKDYNLLVGSWAGKNQIQIFDIRTFKLLENIDWQTDKKEKSTSIYAAQFSKTNKHNLIGVAGRNENLYRIFDKDNKNQPVVTSTYLSKACYSVDFSNNGSYFAYSNGDGNVRVLSLENEKEWSFV